MPLDQANEKSLIAEDITGPLTSLGLTVDKPATYGKIAVFSLQIFTLLDIAIILGVSAYLIRMRSLRKKLPTPIVGTTIPKSTPSLRLWLRISRLIRWAASIVGFCGIWILRNASDKPPFINEFPGKEEELEMQALSGLIIFVIAIIGFALGVLMRHNIYRQEHILGATVEEKRQISTQLFRKILLSASLYLLLLVGYWAVITFVVQY